MDMQQRAAMGRRIAKAREDKGLNKKEAAALADVKYRTYRSIENGETTAQDHNLAKIMTALDIQPLADARDSRPIWLELHCDDDVPDEVKLFAKIAVREWSASLNDLLGLDEAARMTQITRRIRDWNDKSGTQAHD
jgi:transcriptional regulator with XRE-family HTH domain